MANNDLARAVYPVPPTLAQLLEDSTAAPSSLSIIYTEDEKAHIIHQSLTHLLENSIHALDQWYFATPPDLRSALEGHRTCLRLSTASNSYSGTSNGSTSSSSITITDLGVGMTRADLINLLGVGRPIPPQYKRDPSESNPGGDISGASTMSNINGSDAKSSTTTITTRQERIWHRKRLRQQRQRSSSRSGSTISTSTIEEDEDTINNTGEVDEGGEADVNVETDDARSLHSRLASVSQHVPPKEVVGGFYAAACALGVGVKVGTKVGGSRIVDFLFMESRAQPI
jgi:hypothetical protein